MLIEVEKKTTKMYLHKKEKTAIAVAKVIE